MLAAGDEPLDPRQVVLGGFVVPMTNKPWLGAVMSAIPSRWSFEGLLSAERLELVNDWKIRACMPTGTGIVDGKFNCALEEIRNTTEGAGGLGFSTYNQPALSFTVLSVMTLVCIVLGMILLKRRDSV